MKMLHLTAAAAALFAILPATTMPIPASAAGICSDTAAAAQTACETRTASNYSLALGTCANITLPVRKQACIDKANAVKADGLALCTAQTSARLDVCTAIGEAAYSPKIRAADFSAAITNPLMPLRPGDVRVYRSGKSEVTVIVTHRKITLMGVDCIVVHDVKRIDGTVEEDTLDYYAQHIDGSVWYFGEDTIAYDNGIASTRGSWRAGVAGASPGIVMPGYPVLGVTYREEFSLGSAEDVAKNLAINQHVKVPAGIFNNAFKTLEFTPIEPGFTENKYYVPGIGLALTVDVESGVREALVSVVHRP